MSTKKTKPNIYLASDALRRKVGIGNIEEHIIDRAQKTMERNEFDFTPMALDYLDKLNHALEETKKAGHDIDKSHRQTLTVPVMELKANATAFGYPLIGRLGDVMLNFLESVDDVDDDVLRIIQAHHTSLCAIISGKMKTADSPQAKMLLTELANVCARYFARQQKK